MNFWSASGDRLNTRSSASFRSSSEISAYGREIDKAKQAFSDDDPQAIVKAQADLVSAVTKVQAQINQTIADINKKLRE